jgi:hypothetical protein
VADELSRRDFVRLSAAPAAASLGAAPPIESAYSPTEGTWRFDWPGRLAQHDLVYLSPPEDPSLGLPIGNGDIGALVWTTERELVLAINKCDTFDDDDPGPYRNREEKNTALRHCARLVVDFGSPVFDLLYLKDFAGRLEMATAVTTLHSVTPFATASAEAYLSAPHRVLALKCRVRGNEPVSPRVTLERWGSRNLKHWYMNVNRDPALGLDGTTTSIQRGRIVIRQQLRTLFFVVAAQVVPDGGASVNPRRLHGRSGEVALPEAGEAGFTVYVTAVTSENDPDPEAAAHRILDQAVAGGEPAIRKAHEEDWRRFWSASMIDLPEKHLENIWHLTLYFANSSSRGAYPPHFCNGLWGWQRDFVPWSSYFHWNMQDYVWPLHTQNHAELALPYLRYRRDSLPHAMSYAMENLKKPGAFYGDVANRKGYNALGAQTDNNRTPGTQIALDFWRHYVFTLDEKFFRESAWPVIREVARFHASLLTLGDDGRYHILQTSAYEGSPLFDDTITDLAMIRGLFPVAIRAGQKAGHDPTEIGRWRELLDKLAPFRLADLTEPEMERRGSELVHRKGVGDGKKVESLKVFAVGKNAKGEWIRNRFAHLADKMAYYGVPDPELAAVFPSNVIGLAQRGTEQFNAAVTEVRLHPPADHDLDISRPASMEGRADQCMGWCPYPIVLARLGLAQELSAELVSSVSMWQFYPQGFGHYGPYHVFKPASQNRWLRNHPRDAATRKNFDSPTWQFRHFDNEAMPIVSCAINEMLLQSHEGAIRVCPAVLPAWHVRFELAAQGGFLVSAEHRDGKVLFVAVTSRVGGPCRLVHPWPAEGTATVVSQGAAVPVRRAGEIIEWDTRPGNRYIIVPDAGILDRWKVVPVSPPRRQTPSKLKRAILGRDRLF